MLDKILFKLEEFLFKQRLKHFDKILNYPQNISELIKHNRKILFYLINIDKIKNKKKIVNEVNFYFLKEKAVALAHNLPNFTYEDIDGYQKFLVNFIENQNDDINRIIKDFKIRTKLLEYHLDKTLRNEYEQNENAKDKKTA